MASSTITTDAQAPIRPTKAVTINGRVALAIVRGISERTQSIHRSLLQRERQGQFLISGYDHGNSVFFVENFVSPSYALQLANPRGLDICTPHIGYLIDVPSYKIENVDINYCGGTN